MCCTVKNKIIFGAVIVIILIAALGFGAFAADESVTDSTGMYQYSSYGSGVRLDKVLIQPDADFIIPETVDGYTVTNLGNDIFNVDTDTNYSEDIITVTVSDSLVSWNNGAFKNCANIEKFIVPESNTKFTTDEYGVLFNKNMTSIQEVPKNINTTEYVIPNTVTSFYSELFPPKIETLTIPESVTKFSTSAVKHNNQNKVKNLIIEKFREDWPDSVFYAWNSIETVTLGEQSEVICASAFESCSNLKTVIGGENIKKIGNKAFFGCGKLNDVKFKNVTQIGNLTFHSCIGLTSVPFGDKLEKIGNNAFLNCYAITDVTIPASLKVISDGAFQWCKGLAKLTIEPGCEIIGSQAFDGCSLRDIFIPSSVATIRYKAFNYQTEGEITSIVLSEGVRTIGDYAFAANNQYGCKSIVLPESLTSIGKYAFNGHKCSSITIPRNVRSIGANAFASKHVYNNFTLTVLNPDCVFDNESDIFSGLNCLSVIIKGYPGSTAEEYVKNHPEYDCRSGENGINTFTSLCDEGKHVPEKNCSIYTHCKYCGEVMMTHTDENNDDICDICGKFCGEISVSFSGGVLIIYADCENTEAYYEFADEATAVIFAGTVSEIKTGQFADFTQLSVVYISDSVKNIKAGAFDNCGELKTVIFDGVDTVVENGAFGDTSDFYIPVGFASVIENGNIVIYSFSDSTLYLNGSISASMYDYLDMTAAFCMMYDDIMRVKIDSFEAIGFTVYTYDKDKDIFVRADSFEDVTFSLMVDADGRRIAIKYNELSDYLPDGKGTFYIVTNTDDGDIHRDTTVSITDRINQTVQRILAAIVKLMNKLFAFFKKFK